MTTKWNCTQRQYKKITVLDMDFQTSLNKSCPYDEFFNGRVHFSKSEIIILTFNLIHTQGKYWVYNFALITIFCKVFFLMYGIL